MIAVEPEERVRTSGKFLRAGGGKFYVKGVTYGPFDPDAEGRHRDDDLAAIKALGANTVRVYEVPERDFLDDCVKHGLRVMVGIPWPNHVDFIGERGLWDDCVATVREAVSELSDHPGLMAFLVGNEIEATLVRWLGPKKVKRLLEELIEVGRAEDPGALFAYANYPSTEYLNPDNADFLAYNVYLEEGADLARYLARLQNIAGDKPLVVSEFGADSLSLGRGEQARILGMGCDRSFAGGAAGFVAFAFTDEWFRGGKDVRGWDFGLVTREREPKPAHEALAGRYRAFRKTSDAVPVTSLPKFSIIVCTHNGERTLGACLDSLTKLRYPDYEVIVVDDGSEDMTSEIAKAAKGVRYFKQRHGGLSAARNFGAAQAEGDVFAYTDDDCVADEDWLHYLAAALESGEFACVGGPNIPPPPTVMAEACVEVAPGAPAHVLIDDRRAEHLPGCNLAVRREAFEDIGGFSVDYRAAGDDVDFCWRLMAAGYEIGYAPAAMVWHYRRSTLKAYLKQQIGYGRAEALLIGDHPQRFGLLGGARWHGAVYSGRRGALGLSSRIYRGVFGYAPFQAVYAAPESDFFHIATGVQWVLVAGLLLALGPVYNTLLPVGLVMLAVTLAFALREAWRARIDPRFAGLRSKALLVVLCLAQPVVRGGVRTFGALRRGKTPRGPIWGGGFGRPPKLGLWKRVGRMRIWSTRGLGRDLLLEKTANTLRRLGWKHQVDNGWKDWDMEVERGFLWRVRMTTVTEYHGEGQCLTRVRMASKATPLNLIGNVLLAVGVIALAWGEPHWLIWLAATYLLWWALVEVRHRAVVEGLMRLVTNVAEEVGFDRVE